MDLKAFNWEISKQDLANQLKKKATIGADYVHGGCLFWGKECSALFWYSDTSEQIKKVEFTFDELQDSGPGTEATDFKKAFSILKGILGEPKLMTNIDLIQLDKLVNVYKELSYERLPKILWETEGLHIVLRFKDYWGMIPDTYIEKIDK